MNDEVTQDGSPVAVYLALPARDEPEIIGGAVPAGSRILELGCGVGRLTRVLIALGHRVTAVDSHAAMLAHVTGARTVQAPIAGLRLGERFDAVVLASHLINGESGRADLLAACAAHVQPAGVVTSCWNGRPGRPGCGWPAGRTAPAPGRCWRRPDPRAEALLRPTCS